MKKLIICLMLCFAMITGMGGTCYADGITTARGFLNVGIAIWGFSTGGSSYVAVTATIFLVKGVIQIGVGVTN